MWRVKKIQSVENFVPLSHRRQCDSGKALDLEAGRSTDHDLETQLSVCNLKMSHVSEPHFPHQK